MNRPVETFICLDYHLVVLNELVLVLEMNRWTQGFRVRVGVRVPRCSVREIKE
jgi:hypothetical protein